MTKYLHTMKLKSLLFFLLLIPAVSWSYASDLCLIANKGQVKFPDGQVAHDVLYTVSNANGTMHLRADGWDYYQYKSATENSVDSHQVRISKMACRFQGVNPLARLEEGAPQLFSERYFKGGNGEGAIRAHSIREFWIRDFYPGIDYHVYTKDQHLKYEFQVGAGADLEQIRWEYFGDINTTLLESGEIELRGELGEMLEKAPISFRELEKTPISSRYIERGETTWGFDLEDGRIVDYSRTIDPILLWANFMGGVSEDQVFSIETLNDGSIYMSGHTYSSNNIAINGYDTTIEGICDFFLVKLNGNQDRYWASYYGGNGYDQTAKLLLESEKTFYLYGSSTSTNFTTRGTKQSSSTLDLDGMIIKMDSSGKPYWATSFGGDSAERILDITFSADSQQLIVSGVTKSSTPMVNSMGIAHLAVGFDGFLAKFDTAGQLIWSRLHGGNNFNTDYLLPVRVTSSGKILTLYATYSSNLASNNGFKQTYSGNADFILTMFDTSGSVLWSTYFGGSKTERSGDMVLDNLGNIYLTGTTSSSNGIIYNPGVRNSQQQRYEDIFLAKYDTTGKLIWSEYLGGLNNEGGYGLALKNDTTLYLTGVGGKSIFFSGGFQDTANSQKDGILLRLDSAGIIQWGTYFGGDNFEYPYAIKIYGNRILIGGTTNSSDYFNSAGSWQSSFGGLPFDGFLLQVAFERTYSNHVFDSTYCAGDTIDFSFFIEDTLGFTNVFRVELSDINGSFSSPTLLLTSGSVMPGSNTLPIVLPINSWSSSNFRLRFSNSSPSDTFEFKQTFQIKSAPNRTYSGSNKLGLCINDTVHLVSNNPASFQYDWMKDGILTGDTNKTLLVSSPGKYAVRLEGVNGCKSESNPLNFYRGTEPKAELYLNDSLFCANQVQLTLSDSSTQTNGTRQWKLDGIQFASTEHTSIDQLGAGFYQVSLHVQSTDLCWDSSFQNIEVLSAPKAEIVLNDSQACENAQDFQIKLPINHSYTFHQFDFGDSTSSNGDTAIHHYAVAGKYTISLAVSNQYGCKDTLEKQIEVFEAPVADFILLDSLFCTNLPATRFGNRSSKYKNSRWYFGDGDSSQLTHPTHYFTQGNYQVELIVESKDNCMDTLSKALQMVAPPEIIIQYSDSIICVGDQALIQTDCDTALTYFWTGFGTACSLSVGDSLEHELVVENRQGCKDTGYAKIQLYDIPSTPVISQNWDTLMVGDGFATYKWFYEGNAIAGGSSSRIIATQNGVYRVLIHDKNGCSSLSNNYSMTNVGLNQSSIQLGIRLYPNPNTGLFTVSFSNKEKLEEGVSIRLFNSLGQEVGFKIISVDDGSYSIQVIRAVPGVYHLQLTALDFMESIKIQIN